MAAEPSILGAKIKFWQDNTPSEYQTLRRLEDMDSFPDYQVEADGCWPDLAPHRHGPAAHSGCRLYPSHDHLARTPARQFVRGTTEFMIDLVEDPKGAHKLIDLYARDHRLAQGTLKVMGDGVQAFSFWMTSSASSTKSDTLEFAHPYLKPDLRRISEGQGQALPQ